MNEAENAAAQVWRIVVGGLACGELLARLAAAGVLLNNYAETLLAAATADAIAEPEQVVVIERSVRDLGLPDGGTLPEIHERALAAGLCLCPPTTGACLRLAIRDQSPAPDSVLSAGRAPSGSLTIAAPRLRDDHEFPAGLYLRVVDGQRWLRGFRCDDEHVWSADDKFVFRAVSAGTDADAA